MEHYEPYEPMHDDLQRTIAFLANKLQRAEAEIHMLRTRNDHLAKSGTEDAIEIFELEQEIKDLKLHNKQLSKRVETSVPNNYLGELVHGTRGSKN